MGLVTASDLKENIREHNYMVLTDGDDSLGTRALEKARVWLTARLTEISFVFPFDEDDTVIREIIINRALYELYALSDQETVASDKKANARELIAGYISRYAGSEAGSVNNLPAISVTKRKKIIDEKVF